MGGGGKTGIMSGAPKHVAQFSSLSLPRPLLETETKCLLVEFMRSIMLTRNRWPSIP